MSFFLLLTICLNCNLNKVHIMKLVSVSFDLQVQSFGPSSLSLSLSFSSYLFVEGLSPWGFDVWPIWESGLLWSTLRSHPEGERLEQSVLWTPHLCLWNLYPSFSMSPANRLITSHFWLLFTLRFKKKSLVLLSYVCMISFPLLTIYVFILLEHHLFGGWGASLF